MVAMATSDSWRGMAALTAIFAAANLFAAVELVSPSNGASVPLLPPEQKKIMALATYEERLEALKSDKDGAGEFFTDKDSKWRKSIPLNLSWRATAGEKGPWLVRIGERADLVGAKDLWFDARDVKKLEVKGTPGVEFSCTVERANLNLGRRYYWQVWWNVKCPNWGHGSTMSGKCRLCDKVQKACATAVASFTTEDQPPRWIAIEGRVGNIRDVGGWRTEDGRRVRTGMLFRGQGLNDNSVNGDRRGRNRLMVEDVRYLAGELGIKTDLDLRTPGEIADMDGSPLGSGVNFIARSSPFYKSIFDANPSKFPEGSGKQVMAKNFRVFCDPKNYPIYFHCIGGADRTGSLAYVLNGVLGVPRHELEVDWESTFYPYLPEMDKGYSGPDFWRREQHLTEGIAKYGDANSTWRERIELYLLDCGVTREEIERFRSIMLE